MFNNIKASGNREWGKWLISTITSEPSIADRMAPQIPAGEHEIRFEGLDINNFVSLRPLATIRGEVIPDEDIPPTPVPTISEWGLIALAAVMAIMGVLYSRRYRRV